MLKYWLWLSSLRGLGTVKALRLLERFGSPKAVYFAAQAELRRLEGLRPADIKALENKSFDTAQKIMEDCDNLGMSVVTLQDSAYPERLKNIYDPPLILYVKGKLPNIDEEAAVAVVGSRDATPYGLITAEKLSAQIVEHGGIVVSGLAKGIDAAGHRGALKAGGITVAVMGGGADVIYPKENARLYEDIAATGAVISELPPGTEVTSKSFPRRNRIISGLSIAVVIVEAAVRSGALITASLAGEQGREVFAVPGNVDAELSEGCNELIRDGAPLATSGWQILREYAPLFPEKLVERPRRRYGLMSERPVKVPVAESTAQAAKQSPAIDTSGLTQDERDIVALLMNEAGTIHIDEIIESLQIPAARVLSALTMLELSGTVAQDAGKRFALSVR